MKKNRFTLSDYYDQLMQLKKMGSITEIAAMLPGVIIGLVVGVIAYFAIVALLPLASATFTLVQ